MAIMKVFDGTVTHYIFRPEDIVDIRDTKKGVDLLLPVAQGEQGNYFPIRVVTEKNARDVKREIQENADEPIGYLKMSDPVYGVENGRRYINTRHIMSAHPAKVQRLVDGKYITVDGTFVTIDHYGHGVIGVAMDQVPFEVARQIRRVQKRLDQDEELCCTTQVAEEEEAE